MALRVNAVAIGDDEVLREMQYHRAASREDAELRAARALVVREVLRQTAAREGLVAADERDESACQRAIDELVVRHVAVDEPSESDCRAEHDSHPELDRTPDLFEASHILFLAPPSDSAALERACSAAAECIAELTRDPSRFADLARERSGCSSAQSGGSLGQVTARDTVPEFAAVLQHLAPGDVCPAPVRTRFGYHVVRLDERAPGRPLEWREARGLARERLLDRRWRAAAAEFVRDLVAAADVEGLDAEARTVDAAHGESSCQCGTQGCS